MSSSIGSVGSYSPAMMGMSRPPRPDSSKLAEELFAQIDTTGKGYIEKSDLESAFQQVSSANGASADELFTSLDSDGDGKVTQNEMSSGLKSLMDSLDSQFQSMRMNEAMGGMPPPPPPQDDTGFTKEELQTRLDEIGGTDSKRSTLIASIVENFDAADTDSDGKVSLQEAIAYDQSAGTNTADSTESGTAGATSTATGTTSTASSDAQLMLQVMKLAQAYGLFGQSSESSGMSAVA